ncbi:MAG: outer membrane beta-barrel protein, partial [Bacteroidales bacterium]|nr:outer membrane beta-barrel protein [Bacteroidales bacterium]
GLNWNNYVFDGDNNIVKGENDIIEMLDPGLTLKKSKFTVLYFNVPFLFEFQIPTDHQRLNISAGPVGAVKLHSHTKMIYDNKDKIKSDDDLSLNMFRYGATARIGYENFNIYATYYFSPLFKSGKSPGNIDLFPFEIGLSFTID